MLLSLLTLMALLLSLLLFLLLSTMFLLLLLLLVLLLMLLLFEMKLATVLSVASGGVGPVAGSRRMRGEAAGVNGARGGVDVAASTGD